MPDNHHIAPSIGGKQRLAFLDAARALAMIAVVYHHVMIFTLKLNEPIFSGDFVTVFMVPLFFFISGFVAYKPVEYWTLKDSTKKLLNKMQLLLIPTVVFYCLLKYLISVDWGFPGGYWFTYSLFEMFLIYYATSYLCNRLLPRYYTASILIVMLCVIILTVVAYGTSVFQPLRLYDMRIFLPYFVFGILAAKYKEQFTRLIDNDMVITGLLIFCVIACLLIFKINLLEINTHLYTLVYGLLRLALITVLFNCFRKSENYWSGSSVTARLFNLVGRRTLDIYMIHYFFILTIIPNLRNFITPSYSELLIVPVTLALTAIAIALSLIFSYILRSSKFLSRWLFAS